MVGPIPCCIIGSADIIEENEDEYIDKNLTPAVSKTSLGDGSARPRRRTLRSSFSRKLLASHSVLGRPSTLGGNIEEEDESVVEESDGARYGRYLAPMRQ